MFLRVYVIFLCKLSFPLCLCYFHVFTQIDFLVVVTVFTYLCINLVFPGKPSSQGLPISPVSPAESRSYSCVFFLPGKLTENPSSTKWPVGTKLASAVGVSEESKL